MADVGSVVGAPLAGEAVGSNEVGSLVGAMLVGAAVKMPHMGTEQ